MKDGWRSILPPTLTCAYSPGNLLCHENLELIEMVVKSQLDVPKVVLFLTFFCAWKPAAIML